MLICSKNTNIKNFLSLLSHWNTASSPHPYWLRYCTIDARAENLLRLFQRCKFCNSEVMELKAFTRQVNIKQITILFSKVKYAMKNIEKRKTFIKVSQKLSHYMQPKNIFVQAYVLCERIRCAICFLTNNKGGR